MPAVEENSDAPSVTEPSEANLEDAARIPARVRGTGQALERIRNRMRNIDARDYQWIDATQNSLDGAERLSSARTMAPQAERPESKMMAQGTALSTLMRSAARQHSPTPELTPPIKTRKQSVQTTGQPQRDALRKVAQGVQGEQRPASKTTVANGAVATMSRNSKAASTNTAPTS